CLRTIKIFEQFGVDIKQKDTDIVINSLGYKNFIEPTQPLYFGNSGTTARLMLGILAGLPFHTVVYGDKYLTERPMDRVILPLKKMNAEINGRNNGLLLPFAIKGQQLNSLDYKIDVKSAQVKSALIFARLFTEKTSHITDKSLTRDPTKNNETSGDITLTYKSLEGTVIEGELIPKLIDEIPILALLATQANGETIIKDAEELRIKETDRIKAVYETLSILGANVIETEDGLIIKGKTTLT